MKISIIIATYNDPLLKQCLESIYRSENADFETIVVDDGSTSVDAKKITDGYPQCKTFILKHKGPAAARNFGAKKAEGDIVFFMDSDAQLYPDTLQKITECFKNDPALQGMTIIWDDEPVKSNFFNKFKAVESNYLYTDVYEKVFASNGSAIYKNLFLKEGGFDENFKSAHAEDFHFGIKFFSRGYNIILNKKITMKHAYFDNFFFRGMKKYCQRAFLRAAVIYKTKNKIKTSYNSNRFAAICLFSGLVFISIIAGFIIRPALWTALGFYIIFFYINRKLYFKFFDKHGFIFAIRAVIMHYLYILIVSTAGVLGLIYALLKSMGKKIKKYFRWVEFYFSSIPFYAIFYVTSRCNARCAHCFAWKLVDDSNRRKEMSLEEIEKIAKNWGKMLIVNLTGGEAYLRDDLPEIVEIFKKYTGVEIVAIPSNGFMTEKILEIINKLLKRFPDLHFRFAFSVDGIGKKHDDIRGVPGGFEKLMKTIREVIKLKKEYNNFSVFTNSCFMQQNQDDFIDILKFIKENLDVDTIGMTYIRGNVRLSESQKNLYNEKYKEAIDYIAKLNHDKFKNHPLANFIWAATILARKKVFENLKINKRNFECYAIKKLTVIEDTGDVKVCEMLPTYLGNLRENNYDIKKIVTSKLADSECEKIKKHECNCTWECAIRTGIIYNPKEYPALLKCALAKKDKLA